MYFEIDDYRPDITPVGRAISWREGILLSIIFHLLVVILILVFPKFFPFDAKAAQARAALMQQQRQPDDTRFVFVQPRNDLDGAEAAATSRRVRPGSRGARARTLAEPDESAAVLARQLAGARGGAPAAGAGARPGSGARAAAGTAGTERARVPVPESQSQMQLPVPPAPAASPSQSGAGGRSPAPGGSLGDALRNLQRYVPREQFENPGGTAAASVPRSSSTPRASSSARGFAASSRRSSATGSFRTRRCRCGATSSSRSTCTRTARSPICNVVGPCPIEAFNNAAFGALSASNPTTPLPPEYPADKAFFTVTFFYNESPP